MLVGSLWWKLLGELPDKLGENDHYLDGPLTGKALRRRYFPESWRKRGVVEVPVTEMARTSFKARSGDIAPIRPLPSVASPPARFRV